MVQEQSDIPFRFMFSRTMTADHFDCSAYFLRVPSCVGDPSAEKLSYSFCFSKQFVSPFLWVNGKSLSIFSPFWQFSPSRFNRTASNSSWHSVSSSDYTERIMQRLFEDPHGGRQSVSKREKKWLVRPGLKTKQKNNGK